MIDELLAYVLTAADVTSPSAQQRAGAVAAEGGTGRAADPGTYPPRLPAREGAANSTTLDATWERIGLGTVLLLAAGLYLWGLSRNGLANEYYAAAVLSMSQNLSNFFFASFDPGGFITVDKPPFAFWVQAVSARIFGLNSWSILVPQALAGVVAVWALYRMVRGVFGPVAALLAALILTLTPVTVAVNRDNLPDSMLVLLMVLAAWAVLRATRSGGMRFLLLGAALVGLAFNTKMLQAYVVVPSFGLTYLLAGIDSLRRRLAGLLAAGVVVLVVSASWMVAVDAIPPDSRPYIGGSSNNTVLDLVLGYNGFGRIFGNGFFGNRGAPAGGGPAFDGGSFFGTGGAQGFAPGGQVVPGDGAPATDAPSDPVAPDGVGQGARFDGRGQGNGGPGPGGPNFGGQSGWLRLFNEQNATQISWLLPFAALALVAGLVARRGKRRTDPKLAFFVLWGGWLITHFLVFSLARGIFHPYYSVALAPAIAALSGGGVAILWDWYRRGGLAALALPAALGFGAAWPLVLVSRSSWGQPWLPILIAVVLTLAVVCLLVAPLGRRFNRRELWALAAPALAVGMVGVLMAPGLWATTTLAVAQSAITPAAGPAVAFGGPDQGQPGGPSTFQNRLRGADGGIRQRDGSTSRGDDAGQAGNGAAGSPAPGGNVPPGGRGLPLLEPNGNPAPLNAGRGPFGAGGNPPSLDQGPPSQHPSNLLPPDPDQLPSDQDGNPLLPAPNGFHGDGSGFSATGEAPAVANGGPPPGSLGFVGAPFGPGRGAANGPMLTYLLENQGDAKFLLATTGSMGAAPIIIATGKPVMAMGGFSGSDAAPTAEALQHLVSSGQLRFILLGGFPGGPPGGGPGGSSQRTEWVRANCTAVDPAVYGEASGTGRGQLHDCQGIAASPA